MTTQQPKRQARGRRRIEQILDAAAAVFDEAGYEAATTNQIAARAAISPGSLYQFFANKQAIAEALATRYVTLLRAALDEALDPALVELPLDELVARVVDPLLAFNTAHPAAKSLLAGADLSPELAASTQELHLALLHRVEALLAARTPSLKPRDRELAATVTVQIYKALLPTILAANRRQRPAVVRELKAALAGYWATVEAATRSSSA